MSGKHLDELPSNLKEELLEGSEQIFLAAFNSASEDGMDEESARQVAWNTVEHDYQKGDDGKWRRRPQQTNIHNKAVQSGGN